MQMSQKLTGIILSLILLSAGALYPLVPNSDFSENENRSLAKFPQLNIDSVFSGEFTSGIEKYLTDHIAGRDFWMRIASDSRRSVGIKEIENVYLSKSDYLIERFTDSDIDKKSFDANITAIKTLCDKDGISDKITVMPVPDKGSVLNGLLPDGAPMYDYDKAFNRLAESVGSEKTVNLKSVLQGTTSMPTYFKTDHHWTAYGSALAYRAFLQAKHPDKNTSELLSPPLKTLSENFFGTLYSKVLSSDIKPDVLQIPDIPLSPKFSVKLSGRPAESIYDMSYINKKDKYAVYMGGNYAEVNISTGEPSGKGRILIVKDSFANSMVPWMLKDYANIDMIDLRYFTGSLQSYIERTKPDEILVLYQLTNIIKDENIPKIAV